jgi:hypothetical protein
MTSRQDKIRVLIQWIDGKLTGWPLWSKLNPQEAEKFWELWDVFELCLMMYVDEGDGYLPKVREMAGQLVGMVR